MHDYLDHSIIRTNYVMQREQSRLYNVFIHIRADTRIIDNQNVCENVRESEQSRPHSIKQTSCLNESFVTIFRAGVAATLYCRRKTNICHAYIKELCEKLHSDAMFPPFACINARTSEDHRWIPRIFLYPNTRHHQLNIFKTTTKILVSYLFICQSLSALDYSIYLLSVVNPKYIHNKFLWALHAAKMIENNNKKKIVFTQI